MTAVLVHWSKPVLQCIVSKAKMVHSVNNIEPAYLISIRGGGGGVSYMYLTTCHGEANARRTEKVPFCILIPLKNGALTLTLTVSLCVICSVQ